jgi:MoxR-like ATPase
LSWRSVEVYAELLLGIGKSVLLTGAPGTGKTRLALRLAERFTGSRPVVVVGRGDMGYSDLLGADRDVAPAALSVIASWARLRAGCPPVWLLFDEINRANVEVALGELFTALDARYRGAVAVVRPSVVRKLLSLREPVEAVADVASEGCGVSEGDVVAVLESFQSRGVPLPPSWRMLATMNVVDRAHLFRVGSALARRLPPVYVPGVAFHAQPPPRRERADRRGRGRRYPQELVAETCREAVRELLEPVRLVVGGVAVEDRTVLAVGAGRLREAAPARSRVWQLLFEAMDYAAAAGLELGYSVLADTCKLLALEEAMGVRDDERVVDVVLSSLILPHLSTVVPQLKFEMAMGVRSGRQQALHSLRAFIDEVLGPGSLSDLVMRAVELELALQP